MYTTKKYYDLEEIQCELRRKIKRKEPFLDALKYYRYPAQSNYYVYNKHGDGIVVSDSNVDIKKNKKDVFDIYFVSSKKRKAYYLPHTSFENLSDIDATWSDTLIGGGAILTVSFWALFGFFNIDNLGNSAGGMFFAVFIIPLMIAMLIGIQCAARFLFLVILHVIMIVVTTIYRMIIEKYY